MIKKSFGASLLIADTTLYEVPAGKKAEWVLLYATDVSGSTTDFSVDFYDASASATLAVFFEYGLTAKTFFKIGGEINNFIMMHEGDKIIARCDADNDVSMLISVIEYNDIILGG